jgi:bifunctional DNA-binding transcriptional regulator/antitoxin component of YhaV-PrlF toxin-antitoxin module
MTVTVKNRTKTPLVVPVSVRRKAGHQNGEDLEFRVSGGVITILPKLPAADDEYTPEQRRIIDARLAKADADIKAGRISKAFADHGEFVADLHREAAKLSARKSNRLAK